MVRIVSAVIAGFFVWSIAWVGSEMTLSAIWPEGYGVHQLAFQAAIENGGQFTADTTLLLIQVALGSIVSVMSGFLAALIARGNKRASLILGFVLLAFGVLKAVLSWPYVPMWYHVIFTGLLLPMTILGGKLKTAEGEPARSGAMDRNEARTLLATHLEPFRRRSYADLVALMGDVRVTVVTGPSGTEYQIELEVIWDSLREKVNVLVMGAIDDGRLPGAMRPVTDSFIVTPDGSMR